MQPTLVLLHLLLFLLQLLLFLLQRLLVLLRLLCALQRLAGDSRSRCRARLRGLVSRPRAAGGEAKRDGGGRALEEAAD